MLASFTTLLAAASVANAHFLLTFPATIGFSDDKEDTGVCGGFTPNFASSNITDFFVGGDNIATNMLHTQGTWLYRATLDESASGNWTQLFPEVLQTGLGKFCQPRVPAPEAWVGKKGVISVIVDAPDGLLYQCAAVNFVAGTASTNQESCTNSSGVTASFTTDANLASLTGDAASGSAAPSASGTTTGTGTSTSASSSTSATAAATTSANSAAGRIAGPAASVALAAVLGSALMLF